MFMNDDNNPMDPGMNPGEGAPAEPAPEAPAEDMPAAPGGEEAAPEAPAEGETPAM